MGWVPVLTQQRQRRILLTPRRRVHRPAGRMADAFRKLPTQSAILDGELVLIDPRGTVPELSCQIGCHQVFNSGTSHPKCGAINLCKT